jgi:hypothetical protein
LSFLRAGFAFPTSGRAGEALQPARKRPDLSLPWRGCAPSHEYGVKFKGEWNVGRHISGEIILTLVGRRPALLRSRYFGRAEGAAIMEHSRSGLSPFEYLVEKPLLCHRLQKVRRQFANSLIPNGCLKREVPGHGWGKRQWSVLLFAVVPHANGERRGAGRSRLRDRGWLFQLHRPSSRSPCSQTDPQPRAGDLEGAHGDSNLCRNFLAARATCKEVPDLLYALWRKLAWPPAKSRGCPLLQFSIAHGYCLSGYKLWAPRKIAASPDLCESDA